MTANARKGVKGFVTLHGGAVVGRRHPLYARWANFRQRCRNPRHPRYPDYGGRRTRACPGGIYVDARWDDFTTFVADVGTPPRPGYSLDRIDNDGPYSPENVRWATAAQQRANQYREPWPFGVLWPDKVLGGAEAEYNERLEAEAAAAGIEYDEYGEVAQ